MDEKLESHIVSEERRLLQIETDIKSLADKVTSLDTSVSDLVSAWRTATGVVAFVKWLAGAVTAIAVLIAAFKLGGSR